jgi:hypothetical protein
MGSDFFLRLRRKEKEKERRKEKGSTSSHHFNGFFKELLSSWITNN